MTPILVVDDHPPARFLMEAIIRDLTEYDLIAVGSCADALRVAQQVLPMLYIIDLELPDGDGLSLGKALTAVHDAPVIIMSAYADAVVEQVAAAAVFAFLKKPMIPDDVARTIERAIARLD